jgi:hypothetical protein
LSAPAFLHQTKMKRLPLIAALLLAGAFAGVAQTVNLNGIACFFGQKYALFTTTVAGSPMLAGFSLAEGETKSGIKLLTVDAAAGRVEIEDQYGRKFLRLAVAPNLVSCFTASSAGTANEFPGQMLNGSVVTNADDLAQQYEIMAGNPGWGTIPISNFPAKTTQTAAANADGSTSAGGNTGASSGAKSGDATAGTNPNVAGGSGGTSPATTSANPSTEEWYIEASRIEEERIVTTADVLSGNSEPWPRTPLTPPGTPANLVGRGVMFSNHMPGNFVVPGYVDGNWN